MSNTDEDQTKLPKAKLRNPNLNFLISAVFEKINLYSNNGSSTWPSTQARLIPEEAITVWTSSLLSSYFEWKFLIYM